MHVQQKWVILCVGICLAVCSHAQTTRAMLRLPDTGQNTSYTNTFGEDNDYSIFVPFFTINGNGTVTDTVTSLMWQQVDGGEMTIENARIYCDTLTLGGYTDWRLPNAMESFSILNHQYSNPALNTAVFPKTGAEYWWTNDVQKGDATKIWATNAGGGIGNHPKAETISAGGIKKFHVRAVRTVKTTDIIDNWFSDHTTGTVIDNFTRLVWQKVPYNGTLTWEQALTYADTLTIGTFTDWRLPNIKELQSISSTGLSNPAVPTSIFAITGTKKFWSSTTLPNQTGKAWYLDTQYGITTYDDKTIADYVLCVRGPSLTTGITSPVSDLPSLEIFPNPAKDILHIRFTDLRSSSDIQKIQLYNLQGRLVYESLTEKEMLHLPSLSAGPYLLQIQLPQQLITRKIFME